MPTSANGNRFAGIPRAHRSRWISFAWLAALLLASSAGAQQRVSSSASVRLVSETAPDGRGCGKWVKLEYRACKAARSCRVDNPSTGDVNALYDEIEEALDAKTEAACTRLGCPNVRLRNDENSFACSGESRLCMTRTVEYSCQPTRAGAAPRRVSPQDEPQRTNPSTPRSGTLVAPEAPRRPPVGPGGFTAPDPPDDPPGPGAGGPGGLAIFDLDCVEPQVGAPDVLTTAPAGQADTANETVVVNVARIPGLLVSRDGGEQGLSFAGAASLSGGLPQQAGSTCQNVADNNFAEGLKGPSNFPAINFPEQDCDSLSDCWQARESWARAHYYTWVARFVIHHIASQDHVEKKKYLWGRPGMAANGNSAGVKTSPEFWFGPWSDKRFATVKDGIDKLWGVLTSNKTGGISVKLRCPEPGTNPGNVCFTKKPSAHHWVKGTVDLCNAFFVSGEANQGRLIAHELLHHLFVKYGSIWVAVQDTHTHGHGIACLAEVKTEAGYGEDKIRELATYTASNGRNCGHRARNVRNNDTYAQFVREIGDAVYRGAVVEWPLPTPPTPQPPDCVGEENCLCETDATWPANEYFEPDGDFSPDLWCPDNDGEMTCMETDFGANDDGVCKKCEVFRGPGCECDDQRPCATGSCFGDDTFGGGVGHCFEDPPSSWACLADCDRLFNSPAGWCYADYPTGAARCMDHLCTKPQAFECASEGKVCRFGECVVECDSNQDCQEKGYPGTFVCQSNRCEYAFALE